MSLALSLTTVWLGIALLWVAFHGIDAQDATPKGVAQTIAKRMSGSFWGPTS